MTADGLFCLDVGAGPPLVVVHGGPEFDHSYLRPELDRLAGSLRVVYYDQRGRGRSAEGVRPGDVSLRSEIEDLDRVRSERGLESFAVLGHSWGGVLAMEYAVRHPECVSRLILMGTAPASAGDWRLLREAFARNRPAADQEALDALASSDAFARGDLEAEAAYYRIHFRMTLKRPDLLETLVGRLLSNYSTDGVLLARAIMHRLSDETSRSADWNLFPELRKLDVPTLLLHSEHDFIPVELAERIAEAVPGARLSVLPGCGHFTFLEAPQAVSEEVARFCGG